MTCENAILQPYPKSLPGGHGSVPWLTGGEEPKLVINAAVGNQLAMMNEGREREGCYTICWDLPCLKPPQRKSTRSRKLLIDISWRLTFILLPSQNFLSGSALPHENQQSLGKQNRLGCEALPGTDGDILSLFWKEPERKVLQTSTELFGIKRLKGQEGRRANNTAAWEENGSYSDHLFVLFRQGELHWRT